MTKANKQQQFVNWLCGEKVEFPFFKELKEVKQPEYGNIKNITPVSKDGRSV